MVRMAPSRNPTTRLEMANQTHPLQMPRRRARFTHILVLRTKGGTVNTDAERELADQGLKLYNDLRHLSAERKHLHWDLEINRRNITKKQALLRANKIARQALQEEQ